MARAALTKAQTAASLAFAAPKRAVLAAQSWRVPTREPIVLTGLTVPPSVNQLYHNVQGQGRSRTPFYQAWHRVALTVMNKEAKGLCIKGPVSIVLTCCDERAKGDIDNRAKAPIDCLVELGIIDGDDKTVVRRVTGEWSAEPGASIRIEPV